MPPSVIIVGGGIFGVTAALELRRRGLEVSLFDPGPLPHPLAASTDISKVIRMDYGPDEFYMDLMETAFAGWEAWNRAWPRPLYHQTGMLFLAGRALQAGDFEWESFVRLQRRGYALRRMDSKTLRDEFPAWRRQPGLDGFSNPRVSLAERGEQKVDGYFNPRAGWAESAEVVARLVREAGAAGARLYEGQAFEALLERGGRVTGIVTTGGERRPADYVIVAAGAWTPVLLPQLAGRMGAVGQPVLHFRVDPEAYRPPQFPVWAAGIHTAGWYGFPARADGILKIANHGPGWRVDPRGARVVPMHVEAGFRAFLQEWLPGLAQAPLAGARLCLYCDTFDGNFWIDHDPEREGLLACAGGSGHAFKFAPVLGSIIADVLEGQPNPWAGRFAWRQPEGEGGGEIGEGSATPRK
jgi:glycine/D-amino acid oxidase-like deaminating enzyme